MVSTQISAPVPLTGRLIAAGAPATSIPGATVNRLCGSGLEAVIDAHRMIAVGGVLTLSCAVVNLEFAPYFATFLVALALLGIGWNFMFVGGTTLLTTAYDATERVRVQGLHDFIVFASVACTAVSSGAIHMRAGWEVLNLTLVPPVVIALAVVAWHWSARRRVSVSAAE